MSWYSAAASKPDAASKAKVMRRVAMRGGLLTRNDDGEPGVETLSVGLQRVLDCASGLWSPPVSNVKLRNHDRTPQLLAQSVTTAIIDA